MEIDSFNVTTTADFITKTSFQAEVTEEEYGDDNTTHESLATNLEGAANSTDSLETMTRLSDFLEVKVANFLNLYVEAVLLFGGIFCNLIIVVMFFSKKYRKNSSYIFTHCLAFIDFLLLSIVLLTHWVNYNFKQGNKSIHLCRTILFLGRELFDFQAWVIVTMSIDRWVAITYPLKAKFWCIPSRVRKSIGCICLATFLKNIYTFWSADFALAMNKKNKICTLLYSSDIFIDMLFPWIDLLIGSILPFLIVVIFNILTISQIKRANNILYALEQDNPLTRIQLLRQRRENQLSIMMLLISFAFLVLTLPRQVFILIWSYSNTPITTKNLAIYALVHSTTHKLWFSNSSINFWLYFASGSQFRNNLKRYLCNTCHCYKNSTNEESSSKII